MRKYYLISILFLSLVSQLYSQESEGNQFEFLPHQNLCELSLANEDFLIKTRTRQIWKSTSSLWENDSLFEYFYNDLNLRDTLLIHKWRNGIAWGYEGGRAYIYNQNNKISVINYFYSPGYNLSRERYIYNGNNLYRIILDFWSGGGWDDEFRTTYQWNYQNFITMRMGEGRHYIYGFWCYSYKYEYMYDSNNRLKKVIQYDGDCCPSWHLYKQKIYTYDGNDNNIEIIMQNWNSADSIWINDFSYLYEYDNNTLIATKYQDWDPDSSEWKNVWRESYTYTPQNLLETTLKETWSSETKWENYTFRMISYDNDGNWLEDVTQKWDSTSWVNYFRHLAAWDEPVTVKDNQIVVSNYQLSQNYPNPFNPSTTIKYQIPDLSFVILKVYDVLGDEVVTLIKEEIPAGSYEAEFNGNELTSGIYFYRLQAGDFIDTKKMILLK